MKTLGTNTIILSGSSLVAQALTALMYLYVARTLGPDGFGSISAAIGIAMLFMATLDFGINSLTIRQMARTPSDTSVFTSTATAKFVTSVGIGLGWMVVTLGVATRDSTWLAFVPLGAYIALSDITNTLNVVARSRQRMHVVAISEMVQKATALVATLLITSTVQDAILALPFGLVAGGAASAVVAYHFLPQEFTVLSRTSRTNILHLWRSSAGFGLSGLAAQIQRADVSIVAAVAGPAAAGLYAAPARITNMLGVLPSALSAALFPRVAGSRNPDVARREALKSVGVITLLSAAVIAVIFALATPLVSIILGEDYADSIPVLRLILVGMVFACANGPMAALLQAEGSEMLVAKTVGAASCLGLLGVAIGAHLSGARGATTGFLLLQVSIFVVLLIALRRSLKRNFLEKDLWKESHHAHP